MSALLDFDEALARLLAGAKPLRETEAVPTQAASGRVLAQGLCSTLDVPPLDNTSMDGYAVRCADVPISGAALKVAQRIPAGSVGHVLAPGTAARIFTGAPLPAGAVRYDVEPVLPVSGGGLDASADFHAPFHATAFPRSERCCVKNASKRTLAGFTWNS